MANTLLTGFAMTMDMVMIVLLLLASLEDKKHKDRGSELKYYIFGITFMILNILAITYGGHI